jgi:RNA recognition motif-containing protein
MSKKLFVGGLAWATTDESLHDAFAAYGEVTEAKVILDRDTGRSRGFGFVTFSDPAAADEAQAQLDGQPLDGRNIRVNEAQDRRGGGGGGGRGGRGGGYGGGGGGRGGYGGGGGGRGGYGGGGGGGRWD